MSRAPASRQQRVADEQLVEHAGTTLEAFLTASRSRGLSYEEIAQELYRLTGGVVSVSYQTIKRWLELRGVEAGAA